MRDMNFEINPQEEFLDQFFHKFDKYLDEFITDDQRDEIAQYLLEGWEKAENEGKEKVCKLCGKEHDPIEHIYV